MRLRTRIPLLASFFLFLAVATPAQTSNTSAANASAPRDQNAAAIAGTVFDPDGRVVAGARVTLLHAMTQLEERETNSEGKFQFDGLLAGTYQVVGTAAGFDQLPIEVVLQSDENHTLDLHLKLSALLDRVVVSAAPGGALTSQIASSVSVVTAEEIDNRGAQAALDVLRGLPGTEINQSMGLN
jgi:uncharacterized surface anchored protein